MKFVKSNFAKKIIIILVAIMMFNVAMPTVANAGVVDWALDAAGGIFFIPLKALLLSVTTNININLGRLLRGVGRNS